MGLRYSKRKRMERLGRVPDEILVSIGQNNINYERFDESLIIEKANKELDKQKANFDSKKNN